MSLTSSMLLIMLVIVIYLALIEVFSVLFRVTGMTKVKSKFQTISLLTGCGYTTSESEVVVSEKARRNIATLAMITGNALSVIIVSLLINVFLSLSLSEITESLWAVLIVFVALIFFLVIVRIPVINRRIDMGIEKITVRLFKSASRENVITLLDRYGNNTVAEIFLHYVPEALYGKTLAESNVKSKYHLNFLTFTRKNQSHDITGDTLFQKGDILVVFGSVRGINELFLGEAETGSKAAETVPTFRQNALDLLETYGKDSLVQVTVNTVPAFLEGKTLLESQLRDLFRISIVAMKHNEKQVSVTRDTKIHKGDNLIVIGPFANIKTVFIINNNEAETEQLTIEQ